MQTSAQPTAKFTEKQRSHLFSTANARIMAAKSVEARRTGTSKRLQRAIESLEKEKKFTLPTVPDVFPARILSRLRKQVSAAMGCLEAELAQDKPSSKILKELADALGRLSELERQLSGRPLPGSLRPTRQQTRRPSVSVLPEVPSA